MDLLIALVVGLSAVPAAEGPNLVANGSFETPRAGDPAAPEAWASAGNPAVKQRLTLDGGSGVDRCAKLECTEFSGDGPDFHVMACQTGRVAVAPDRWYRISFRARAERLRAGSVELALSDTRRWENAGLAEAFRPGPAWKSFEFVFRSRIDLHAAASRLQFWFKGTGALWLDDVALVESPEGQRWFPEISAEGAGNLIPNSSFECGGAGWGGFTWGLAGWAGNLFRLEAEVDGTVARHGSSSLKIALDPKTSPVFWFDYFQPVRQPVRRVLAANHGWFTVEAGEKFTLSAFLRSDAEGVIAQLAASEPSGRLHRREVTVGREWVRGELAFAPAGRYFFVAAGLDLEASKREAATLWIDGLQLERGDRAAAYQPRRPVEAFLEPTWKDLFSFPARAMRPGASATLRAFNDGPSAGEVRGRLAVTDFFDRKVSDEAVFLSVPAHGRADRTFDGIGGGRRGFFRAAWSGPAGSSSLRLAVLDIGKPGASPFGFNHAFPWDFLVGMARNSGVPWWRDWSAKWGTVEPEKGRFDFAVPAEQIDRVRDLGSAVDILLPFPSAAWSSTARAEEVERAAGKDGYLRSRLPLAFPPRDLEDFGRYAAETVRRFRQPDRESVFEVLNEPVYTDYALPRKFGFGLDDYLRLLEVASRAMKAADPRCTVVGGIGAGLEAGLTREFIEKGGGRLVDAIDVHIYDPPRPAEAYEEAFASLEGLMAANGGVRPIWLTEWGCYADDDPPCIPLSVGDDTMNRCRWESEREAAEHIVKFAAVGFSHGLRKLFFHAGTCGTINGPDAGSVLFEYGGAPRKMLPAVSALAVILGTPEALVESVRRPDLFAAVFRSGGRAVAVAWRNADGPPPGAAAGARVLDLFGNDLAAGEIVPAGTPFYLVGEDPAAVIELLKR
jgi:hypothetical protein